MPMDGWLQIGVIIATMMPAAIALRQEAARNHRRMMETLSNLSLRLAKVEWKLGIDNGPVRQLRKSEVEEVFRKNGAVG